MSSYPSVDGEVDDVVDLSQQVILKYVFWHVCDALHIYPSILFDASVFAMLLSFFCVQFYLGSP